MNAPRQSTAKECRILELLATELVCAQNAYAMRSHRDNARSLKERATRARLTYRRFWRATTGWYNWPDLRTA